MRHEAIKHNTGVQIEKQWQHQNGGEIYISCYP